MNKFLMSFVFLAIGTSFMLACALFFSQLRQHGYINENLSVPLSGFCGILAGCWIAGKILNEFLKT